MLGAAAIVAEAGIAGTWATGPRASTPTGFPPVPGTALVYAAGEKLAHACIETCLPEEPLGVARGLAWMSNAPPLGRQAPLPSAPLPASVPEEGLRLFWHARGLRSTFRHAGLWAAVGLTLVALFLGLPGELVGEVVGSLSSRAAALGLRELCEEVGLVGCICVPVLGALCAVPYAMAAAA